MLPLRRAHPRHPGICHGESMVIVDDSVVLPKRLPTVDHRHLEPQSERHSINDPVRAQRSNQLTRKDMETDGQPLHPAQRVPGTKQLGGSDRARHILYRGGNFVRCQNTQMKDPPGQWINLHQHRHVPAERPFGIGAEQPLP